jgi:hypothetical protein
METGRYAFRVLEGTEPRIVELTFGEESDLKLLSLWRLPLRLRKNESARDAVDYARLASKRWRYHNRSGYVATKSRHIQENSSSNPQVELAFLLLARATWNTSSTVLGFAHCRRTWCGHIFLDFLSVHPRIVAHESPTIRGVGAGILFGLCALAVECGIQVVWGETTNSSIAFYRRVLNRSSILDCLKISGVKLQKCSSEFERIRVNPS